jgi:hypothetical protein
MKTVMEKWKRFLAQGTFEPSEGELLNEQSKDMYTKLQTWKDKSGNQYNYDPQTKSYGYKQQGKGDWQPVTKPSAVAAVRKNMIQTNYEKAQKYPTTGDPEKEAQRQANYEKAQKYMRTPEYQEKEQSQANLVKRLGFAGASELTGRVGAYKEKRAKEAAATSGEQTWKDKSGNEYNYNPETKGYGYKRQGKGDWQSVTKPGAVAAVQKSRETHAPKPAAGAGAGTNKPLFNPEAYSFDEPDAPPMSAAQSWKGAPKTPTATAGTSPAPKTPKPTTGTSESLTVSRSKLTNFIKEDLREIMDLPSDLSTPAGPEEERMDALSKGWEELITTRMLDGETGIWSNTDVVDPIDGERRLLDEFLAILGNYVVSDEVDEGTARDLVKSIADQISDNLIEPSPHEWGIPLPKWENMPGFEPQDELQEGGRAGHLEPEDAILKALQNVVSAWEPETPEGQKYEADILDLLGRFEEPLRLSAPTDRDVRRLRHGVKTGEWRQKKPWEK